MACYMIKPKANNPQRAPRPHRYPIGYRLGRLIVIQHLQRIVIVSTTGKMAHNYRLRCRCGEVVHRDQEALRQAERIGRVQMCDECAKSGVKEKPFTTPIPKHWGYDPREAM